jgi:hypothetical protein
MVAPLAVLGIITGIGAVVRVLAAPTRKYWVIWVDRKTRNMIGKKFDDQIPAEGFQQALARQGRSSAIVVRYGATWDLTHPVQRVIHQGRKRPIKLAPVTLPEMVPAAARMTGRHDDFDTLEERFKTNSSVNPWPKTPEWARRANRGPYPDTSMPKDRPVRVKDFRDTSSSHEWKSDVKTRELPLRFQTPDRFPGENVDVL